MQLHICSVHSSLLLLNYLLYILKLHAGIVDNAEDSLFAYAYGENWLTFYDPDFIPIFELSFTDPDLEELANTLCGDDVFCLYDIAATGRAEIGMSTLQGGQEFEELIELSKQSMFYAKFILITFM